MDTFTPNAITLQLYWFQFTHCYVSAISSHILRPNWSSLLVHLILTFPLLMIFLPFFLKTLNTFLTFIISSVVLLSVAPKFVVIEKIYDFSKAVIIERNEMIKN